MGSGITGDYEIKNGKLVIYYTIEENTFSNAYDYTFSDNDTTLTLTTTDGDDMVYTKQ